MPKLASKAVTRQQVLNVQANLFSLIPSLGALGWFIYNNIVLQVTSVRQVNRQAMYNGPDYLYTRHTVHISCYYNPAYSAYLPAALGFQANVNRPPDPVVFQGSPPALTDVAIRTALLEPRRQLLWIIGPISDPTAKLNPILPDPIHDSVVILASPDPVLGNIGASGSQTPVLTVDANNGPIPIFCNVARIHGTKTFQVEYIIQTDLNENYAWTGNFPPPLLSNRWSMEMAFDEQFFTTRVIHGRAIFRTDALTLLNARPDDYREWLFFPVPAGFRRLPGHVQQNAEGNQIDYVIVDQEQQISLSSTMQDKFGLVKTEITHRIYQEEHGLESVPHQLLGFFGKLGDVALRTVGATEKSGNILGAIAGAGKAMIGAVRAGAEAVIAMLPRQVHEVHVRAWGDASSNRDKLMQAVFLIIQARLLNLKAPNLPIGGGFFFEGRYFNVTHDVMKKFVDVSFTLMTGPIGTLFQNVFNGVQNNPLSGMEFIQGITQQGGQNPYPRGSALIGQPNAARGNYLAAIVTAALQPQYQNQQAFFPPQNTQATAEPQVTPRTLP